MRHQMKAELVKLARRLEEIADSLGDNDPHGATLTPSVIRRMIRARRRRSHYFPGIRFADPAWDIMLDLMAARLENKRISISSACIASAVPASTALRWIDALVREGIVERLPDDADGRRVYVRLSDSAALSMASYLQSAADPSRLPIPGS